MKHLDIEDNCHEKLVELARAHKRGIRGMTEYLIETAHTKLVLGEHGIKPLGAPMPINDLLEKEYKGKK